MLIELHYNRWRDWHHSDARDDAKQRKHHAQPVRRAEPDDDVIGRRDFVWRHAHVAESTLATQDLLSVLIDDEVSGCSANVMPERFSNRHWADVS